MTEYLPQLLLAWSIQLTGVLSPGPGVALIMGVAMSQGRTPALITTLGIACGAIVLATATVIGLAAVFAQVAALMTAVKLIGAAYLLWLAYGSFGKALRPPQVQARQVGRVGVRQTMLRGFVMQISNPKALFFWLAVAAVGGTGNAPLPVVAVFLAGAFAISFAGHGLWALVLSSNPFRAAYTAARRPIEAALGGFFVFAAYKLATSRS